MAFLRGIGGTPLNIFTHYVWYEYTLHHAPTDYTGGGGFPM